MVVLARFHLVFAVYVVVLAVYVVVVVVVDTLAVSFAILFDTRVVHYCLNGTHEPAVIKLLTKSQFQSSPKLSAYNE